jgi:hypothetical protein
MMEAINTSETSASFYQTAWLSIPEKSRVYIHRREKFHTIISLALMWVTNVFSLSLSFCDGIKEVYGFFHDSFNGIVSSSKCIAANMMTNE